MTPVRMSKVESSVRVALAFWEAFNRQDVEAALALLSEDCFFEPVESDVRIAGREEIELYLRKMLGEGKPASLEIESVFGLGLHVIIRWQMSALRGVDIFKFRGDLICEKLSYMKV